MTEHISAIEFAKFFSNESLTLEHVKLLAKVNAHARDCEECRKIRDCGLCAQDISDIYSAQFEQYNTLSTLYQAVAGTEKADAKVFSKITLSFSVDDAGTQFKPSTLQKTGNARMYIFDITDNNTLTDRSDSNTFISIRNSEVAISITEAIKMQCRIDCLDTFETTENTSDGNKCNIPINGNGTYKLTILVDLD